jgi:hypothetical protein
MHPQSDTNRTDLSGLCSHYGAVAYVDFRFGESAGYVRFKSADGARAALKALGAGNIVVGGCTPSWRLLDAEEEEAYREAVQSKKRSARDDAGPGVGSGGSQAAVPKEVARPTEPSPVLRFEGAGEGGSREAVAEACARHAEVAYVDFRFGDTAGYVRFKSADGARAALFGIADGALIGNATPNWRQLTNMEAHQYRESAEAARAAAKGSGKGGGGGGKGGGRRAPRGWGGFGGRGRGRW